MNGNFKIFLTASALAGVLASSAPPFEYKIEESGNNLILVTPDGRRILFGDQNMASERAYQFEIPLSELRDSGLATEPDRKPASVAQPSNSPSPVPSPFYDPDWDWEDDEEPVVIVPSPKPSPTPSPTPKVEYDGSDTMILKANRLFHRRKFYEAALYVDEVLRRNPKSLRAWLMKGSILYKLNQKDLAYQAWQTAAKLDKKGEETKGILERYK